MSLPHRKWNSVQIGAAALGVLALVALAAPWLCPFDPDEIDITRRLLAPSWSHWLGTDDLGRDVFSRMLMGARVSLGVGVAAAGLTSVVGVTLGAVSGYFGKKVDMVIMRTVDILMCIPSLYLIIILIVILGPGIMNVIIVIAITGWTGMARIVRAEILSLKSREFALSARAAGGGHLRVLFKHLLPNAMMPVYVAVTFDVAAFILMESGLSFLGLGVQPPMASWGNILTTGRQYISLAWWLTVFPGFAILITLLLVNYLGEGLRKKFKAGAGA